MKAVLKILFWLSAILAGSFLVACCAIGRETLLAHAAKVKPYAVAFQRASDQPDAGGGSESAPGRPVVFLGDSSVAQPPWAVEGSPPIPALLQDAIREVSPRYGQIQVIDWSYPGARPFHYYCLLFLAEKRGFSLLIIPINWRGLGPGSSEWRRMCAFPELSALVPARERRFPSGRAVMAAEDISPLRQRFYLLHRPLLFLAGLKPYVSSRFTSDVEDVPQRRTLQMLSPDDHIIERYSDDRLFRQYPEEIPEGAQALRTLDSIVETASRRRLTVLFYIAPIHLDEMRRRPAFDAAAFAASVDRITAAATSETTVCLNLTDLLRERDFIDNIEHYAPAGNRAVAAALAPKVQELLPAAYPPQK